MSGASASSVNARSSSASKRSGDAGRFALHQVEASRICRSASGVVRTSGFNCEFSELARSPRPASCRRPPRCSKTALGGLIRSVSVRGLPLAHAGRAARAGHGGDRGRGDRRGLAAAHPARGAPQRRSAASPRRYPTRSRRRASADARALLDRAYCASRMRRISRATNTRSRFRPVASSRIPASTSFAIVS